MKKEKILFLSYYFIGLVVIDVPILALKALIWPQIATTYIYFIALGLMFISIVFLRLFLIFLYDIIKIDFSNIERKKAGKKYNENHITRKIDKIKKTAGKISIIFLLTVTLDPIIAIIYCSPNSFESHKFINWETRIVFILGNLWTVFSWGNIIEIIF